MTPRSRQPQYQSTLLWLTFLSRRSKEKNPVPWQMGERGCRAAHTKSQTTRCPLSRPPADVCTPRARPPPAAGRSLVASVTGAPSPPHAFGGQHRELFPAVRPRCDARLVSRRDTAAAHGIGAPILCSRITGSVGLGAVQERAATSATPAACGQFQDNVPTLVAHGHELEPVRPWSTAVLGHAARPEYTLQDTTGHRKKALHRRP